MQLFVSVQCVHNSSQCWKVFFFVLVYVWECDYKDNDYIQFFVAQYLFGFNSTFVFARCAQALKSRLDSNTSFYFPSSFRKCLNPYHNRIFFLCSPIGIFSFFFVLDVIDTFTFFFGFLLFFIYLAFIGNVAFASILEGIKNELEIGKILFKWRTCVCRTLWLVWKIKLFSSYNMFKFFDIFRIGNGTFQRHAHHDMIAQSLKIQSAALHQIQIDFNLYK